MNSPEIEHYMHQPYQEGIFRDLIQKGHRHEELFNIVKWWNTQALGRGITKLEVMRSRPIRHEIMSCYLEVLEAGYPLTPKNLEVVLGVQQQILDSQHRERSLRWIEGMIDQNCFKPLSAHNPNNVLTMRAISLCASHDSLPVLQKACEKLDLKKINEYCDSEDEKEDFRFVLSKTCRFSEQLPLLKYLIDYSKTHQIVWSSQDDQSQFLLKTAVEFCNSATIRFLVLNGFADLSLSLSRRFKNDILAEAIENISPITFMRYKNIHEATTEILETLIDVGAPASLAFKQTEVLISLINKQRTYSKETLQWLLDQGFDPNQLDNFGYSPLWHAVATKNKEAVEILLDNGANINFYRNSDRIDNQNCLGRAAQSDAGDIFRYLLSRGADLSALDPERLRQAAGPSVIFILDEMKAQKDHWDLHQSTSSVLPRSRPTVKRM